MHPARRVARSLLRTSEDWNTVAQHSRSESVRQTFSRVEPRSARTALGARSSFALAAVGVTVLAAALRAFGLSVLPGLHSDEAANGFDIIGVLNGSRPIFFPANTGREPLFIYFQSVLAALVGLSPISLRLAGSIFGIVTIPATYVVASEVFGWRLPADRARIVAIIASLVVATNCWHLYFSGFGLRLISLPFFELLTVGLLWRGLRTDRLQPFILAGLCGAATMYTYSASRVFPLVGLFLLAAALLAKPKPRRMALVLSCAALWAAGFAPLGYYYLTHAAEASLRAGTLSIFAPENVGSSPLAALAESLARHAAVILPTEWFSSDVAPQTRRSFLDPVALAFAWIGVGAAVLHAVRGRPNANGGEDDVREGRAWMRPEVFCLVWFLVMATPSIGTMNTPNYMRMIGSLPPAALLVGCGAEWALSRIGGWRGIAVVAVALLASVALNLSALWYGWLGTSKPAAELGVKYEAGQRLADLTESHRVYLAPLYFQDDAVRFGARARLDQIQVFDPHAPPVSVDRPVAYAFPSFDVEQPAILRDRLGGDVRFVEIKADDGRPLLVVGYAEPRQQQSAALPLVSFADTIDLVEMRVAPAVVRPGEPVQVFLTWRARREVIDDYTIFTHLRRGASETVAQTDVRPGRGRSATFTWRPGDALLDEVVIHAPPDAAPGEYRVVAGLYRLATLERLEAVADGKPVAGNEVEVGRLTILP